MLRTKTAFLILVSIGIWTLFHHCAQIAPLTGGKKDTTPPKLIQAIPQDKSTGFLGGEISLLFDENIQLKDLTGQLIVSPKIKNMPTIEAGGKKILISMKGDELQTNTTYRLYFGNAIADLNESNALKDFSYVFSTGDHIDSLHIRGSVREVNTGKPSGATTVGLYKVPCEDSVVFKTIPDYMTKSNDNGEFSIAYLPVAEFRVFAFQDKNKNILYDGESEKVAFRTDPLNLTKDTNVTLRLFAELPVKNFLKRSRTPYYGLAQLIYNKRSVYNVTTQDHNMV